jgi:Ca2+-binding RTX toxin-like protein
MLTGTKVRLGILAPTRDETIARAVTKTISRKVVEFSNTHAYDITDDDAVVPASIDISGARITARILAEEDGSFRDVNNKSGFNGYTLTFDALTDNPRAEILSVRTLDAFSSEGIGAARVTFDADTIAVNLDDLPFAFHDTLTLQFGLKLTGASGRDGLAGYEGRDALYGRAGADALRGNKGDDLLSGGSGDDRIHGGTGHDTLQGGLGDDRLIAGPGADRLLGGAGADWLEGGGGADLFIFHRIKDSGTTAATRDRIADFTPGEDRIHLSHIDANTHARGDQRFHLIGDDAFSGASGELRVFTRSSGTYVAGDVDGDGRADFSILLAGKIALGAEDFIL